MHKTGMLNYQMWMEVMNIIETKAYELSDEEKVPVIKNWLDWEGLKLINTFTNEKCKMAKGLFSVLSDNFRLCHNRIGQSFQFRIHNESAQEWMGRL